jgi:hypothetical protein
MSKFDEFISGSYKDISNTFLATQETINYYPEVHQIEDKEVVTLKSIPGTKLFCSLAEYSGLIRSMHLTAQNRFFVVKGTNLIEILADATSILRGNILTDTSVVNMADNGQATTGAGNQLMIVDGTDGWIYDLVGNTITKITDPQFPVASQVVYQDTYFIVNEVNTNQLHISDSFDGLSWQGFQGGAEGSPDTIVNFISTSTNIWVFGQKSAEIFADAGNPGFPYERIPQTFQNIGLLATQSLAGINNVIFFLGTNNQGFGQIRMSNGLDTQIISNQLLDNEIQSYATPTDAIGWCYQDDGHIFYILNFKNANKTWCYDLTNGKWSERRFGTNSRWKYDYIAYTFNKNLVANFYDGKIYELSSDIYTDAGSPIFRVRTSPHVFGADNKWIFYNKFELSAKVGVGLDGVQQGTDPKIILNYSKDGGNTWSNDLTIGLGKIGEYTTRLQWRRLGRARSMVFRVTCSEPVSVQLMGAWIDVNQGLN